jgi:hypothetical protein
MSNDRINELPICAKLLAPTERTRNSDFGPAFVNPDGLEAAALIETLVDALEEIGLRACNHSGWVENNAWKGVCEIHSLASAALSKARAQ